MKRFARLIEDETLGQILITKEDDSIRIRFDCGNDEIDPSMMFSPGNELFEKLTDEQIIGMVERTIESLKPVLKS